MKGKTKLFSYRGKSLSVELGNDFSQKVPTMKENIDSFKFIECLMKGHYIWENICNIKSTKNYDVECIPVMSKKKTTWQNNMNGNFSLQGKPK